MKNGLGDADDAQQPPFKRIKLEEDTDVRLLSAPPPAPTKKRTGGGRKSKSSSEERARELLKDVRISAVEPRQVLCRMCGNWVRLFKHTDFSPANWRVHAERCEIRTKWRVRVKREPDDTYDLTLATIPEPQLELLPLPPEVEEIKSTGPPRRGKATEERKRLLEEDGRAKEAGPHDVLCGICDTWVRLHNTREYDLWNWSRHIEKCEVRCKRTLPLQLPEGLLPQGSISAPLPNGLRRMDVDDGYVNEPSYSYSAGIKREPDIDKLLAVNMEASVSQVSRKRRNRKSRDVDERLKSLVDDPRCGEVRPHEVFCLKCEKWIRLSKELHYIDSNWVRHAERCSAKIGGTQMEELQPGSPRVKLESASIKLTIKIPAGPVPTAHEGNTGMSKDAIAIEKRFGELRDDSRISDVEPHRVKCGLCRQWIKLQCHRVYDLQNWRKHARLCEQRQACQSDVQQHKPRDVIPINTGHLGSVSAPVAARPVNIKCEKSSDERRDELLQDIRCDQVEPHRVFCLMCSRHIGLHAKKDYSLSNWYKHANSCKGKPSAPKRRGRAVPQIVDTQVDTPDKPADEHSLPLDPLIGDEPSMLLDSSNTGPISVTSNGPRKASAEDRRQELIRDSRVAEVQPDRVHCALCDKWLKLSKDIPYATSNWNQHVKRCEEKKHRNAGRPSSVVPIVSSHPTFVKLQSPEIVLLEHPPLSASPHQRKRTTVDERLSRLKGDSRIKELEPHRVQCGLCEKWIKLQNKTEYDPHNWFTHVNKCRLKPPTVSSAPAPVVMAIEDKSQGAYTAPYVGRISYESPVTTDKVVVGNAESRKALLLRDPRAGTVEPHRVLCNMCNQWIKLANDKEYVTHNFFKHANRCEGKQSRGALSSPVKPRPADHKPVSLPVVKLEPETIELGFSFNRKTDDQREAELRADPRLAGVERGRVFCKMCNNWIKLNNATGYLPGNWLRHAVRCQRNTNWQGDVPSTENIPPELQAVELIDLSLEDGSDPISSGAFGYVELGHLVSAFEPTVSSTDFIVKSPELREAQKNAFPPVTTLRNLRARTSHSAIPVSAEEHLSDLGRRVHRTEESRKEELERDHRTSKVLPDKILCAMCGRWIQMRRDVSYSSQNWLKHAGICEIRSGWLEKTPVKSEESDDGLPFNARLRKTAAEDASVAPGRPLKPVDWTQEVIYSDDEGEECALIPGNVVEVPTQQVASAPMVKVKAEPPSSAELSEKLKTSAAVPTPLTLLRAKKNSKVSNQEAKKDKKSSKTPPTSNPFTSVPLVRPIIPGSMNAFVASIRNDIRKFPHGVAIPYMLAPTLVPIPQRTVGEGMSRPSSAMSQSLMNEKPSTSPTVLPGPSVPLARTVPTVRLTPSVPSLPPTPQVSTPTPSIHSAPIVNGADDKPPFIKARPTPLSSVLGGRSFAERPSTSGPILPILPKPGLELPAHTPPTGASTPTSERLSSSPKSSIAPTPVSVLGVGKHRTEISTPSIFVPNGVLQLWPPPPPPDSIQQAMKVEHRA